MIESPKKGLEARFKDYKAFAWNHPFFAAFVIIWCVAQPIWSVISTVKSWGVDSLNEKITDQERTISNQKTDIQRLETILIPFKTVALERYSGSETEVLAKLATHISDLDNSLRKTEEELEKIKPTANYAMLRRVANIHPNGMEVSVTGSGSSMAIRDRSIIYNKLSELFGLINELEDDLALKQLAEISSEVPEWPYSYYYSGVVSGEESYFKTATTRFEALRRSKIIEPTCLLFEAMSLTFLKRHQEANDRLNELSQTKRKPEDVPAIIISEDTPSELKEKFGTIAKEIGFKVLLK